MYEVFVSVCVVGMFHGSAVVSLLRYAYEPALSISVCMSLRRRCIYLCADSPAATLYFSKIPKVSQIRAKVFVLNTKTHTYIHY